MKWFIYLKRTPLAQIRADWAEYRALRHKCLKLRLNRNAAKEHLTAVITDVTDNGKKFSCIRHYYLDTSTMLRNNEDLNNTLLFIHYGFCRKFDEDGEKCTDTKCPHLKNNHEYADACNSHDAACCARRNFWRTKFAQACQNLK